MAEQLTIPEGAGDVILGYVRSKSQAWTPAQMVDRVRDGLERLEAAARSIPDEQLDVVPEGEEWTPAHCIAHVCEINLGTATRCHAAATTGTIDGAATTPLPAGRHEMLPAHRERMEALLTDIAAVEPGAHAGVRWDHPLLGPLTWPEWLLTLRVHSLGHADQLARMAERRS